MNSFVRSDKLDENITLTQAEQEYKEAMDIFPALHKYQTEHNSVNLQKLCVEIAEFCRAVYASTQNENERDIYYGMLEKLNKKNRP
nr:MAG TPA: hypothetical protein [Caudoviricetes sp.]